ncbi:MDR family MFS transporter [Streptomyces sp. NPDC089799]|uniref:MDR family MFS transporter n=1 Tax=Streptomyces sp. NPDC089799 TaxID=3155066 RepID=UPI003440BCD1
MLSALVLITFIGSLDSTILATALPTIAGDLGDLRHLSWVVTAYLLAVTGSALIWGKLGDLFGRKRLLQTAITLFLLGSLLCSRAEEMPELICFRALQGLGAGGMWVIPQAVLTGLVGPRERGRYQVFVAGAGASAAVLGPLIGGLLVEHGSWRWAFYVNLPVGVAVMTALAFGLRDRRASERPRIDYWGSLLISACAAGVTLLVTWGGVVFAWFSPPMLVLSGTVAVLLVLIRRVERTHPDPLLPGRVVRERVFRIAVPLSFFFWVVQSGTVNYLPLFFQVVKGASPTASGLLLLPMSLSGLLAYSVSGQALSMWGRYRPFPIIGALLIITGLVLCAVLDDDASPLAYGGALVVLGLGFGLVSQIALVAAQSACAYEDVGVVTSGVIFFRNLGSAFGAALFGAVLNRRLVDHLVHGIDAGEFTAAETALIHRGEPLSGPGLSPTARQTYVGAYELAVDDVFLTGLAVSLLVLALACALPAVPLRRTMTQTGTRKDTHAIPSLPAGDDHVRQALEELARGGLRPVRLRAEVQARRHGISLDEVWLLCIVAHGGSVDSRRIAGVMAVSERALDRGLRSLRSKELLSGGDRPCGPTPLGRELVADLSGTLRAQLGPAGPGAGPGPDSAPDSGAGADSAPDAGPRRAGGSAAARPAAPADLRAHALEILAEGSAFRPRREREPERERERD